MSAAPRGFRRTTLSTTPGLAPRDPGLTTCPPIRGRSKRIKEQQLDLFATRTSGKLMRVNQIRLWLSGVAYSLIEALRRIGLAGTELANAYCGTIRLKLLKIGARIRVTVRRV